MHEVWNDDDAMMHSLPLILMKPLFHCVVMVLINSSILPITTPKPRGFTPPPRGTGGVKWFHSRPPRWAPRSGCCGQRRWSLPPTLDCWTHRRPVQCGEKRVVDSYILIWLYESTTCNTDSQKLCQNRLWYTVSWHFSICFCNQVWFVFPSSSW